MIIKEFQLEKFINEKNQSLNILIYGPNEGLVREKVDSISQNYLSKDEYEKVNISGKDLDSDPQIFDNIVRTVSMFYEKKNCYCRIN
tara:strand:+ start:135 stop:395 length:261 start_codon:yes stop_codon:yes gene_type:complete